MKTPISWLAAILISILTAGLFFPAISSGPTNSKGSITAAMINQLNVALTAYKTEYGSLPPTSENFRLVPILKEDNPRKIVFMEFHSRTLNLNQEIIDGWGTPLRFTFTDSDILIESAGKDRIFGTKDDMSNKP